MKKLNEKFTDSECRLLLKAKGDRTWHDMILEWAKRNLKEAEVK